MAKQKAGDSIDRLIAAGMAIDETQAIDAGSLGFMARAMVQASLPSRKVIGNEFVRRNGNYTLTIMAPSAVGLPYGTIPRLLLAWLATEAVKTKSREIELGDSLSAFMRDLGMSPTGGRWGSITRLKDQARRLFASTISAAHETGSNVAEVGYRLADKTLLWWDGHDPDQSGLWQSRVTLSETFYQEVIAHPVPIDMRALQAIKRSPLAIDIYCWLTWRASFTTSSSLISWTALSHQFGADYARLRDFKSAFAAELRKVALVYPEVAAVPTDDGLRVSPARTSIPMRSRKTG